MFGVPYVPAPPPDHWLTDEERVTIGQLEGWRYIRPGIRLVPCVFIFRPHNFSAGDTLFRGSIGRTDLWGGDFEAIEQSIRERLYTLDARTAVVTGHGAETEIGLSESVIPSCGPDRGEVVFAGRSGRCLCSGGIRRRCVM